MSAFLNFDLLRNPLNWLIVYAMVMAFVIGAAFFNPLGVNKDA